MLQNHFNAKNIIKQNIRTIFILLLIVILNSLGYLNFYLAHSIFENTSSFIAVGIFMFSVNTYNVNKNRFLLNLGIGYLFVAIFDLLHAYSFGDMIIFQISVSGISGKFWLAARFVELLTLLYSSSALFKDNNSNNNYFNFIFYSIISSILVIDIVYLNKIIPQLRIEGIGQTQFKIISEYIITAGFILCVYIYRKFKNFFDYNLYVYLELSLVTKVISELFIIMYSSLTDNYMFIGHFFKVVSFYFLYKGIIVNGIQRPFDMIIHNLEEADKSLAENEKQQRLLEYVISHNEQCNDLLIKNSSNGIMVIRDSKIIYVNNTYVNLLGAKDYSEIKGKSILDFIHEDNIALFYDKLDEFNIQKRIIPFFELKVKSLDGNAIDVECLIGYITYRGKPAILSIAKDIRHTKKINILEHEIVESERKLNASYEYNKLLTEFFSNISHELKTPLNIILGSIQLMQHDNELTQQNEQKRNEILGIMKQNTYRLIRLINNLIDFSKYDSGYLKLNKHNHDIVNIVEGITFSVGQYFKYRDIKIIFDTDVEEKIMAVDVDMIERIILNLLSNAVKFTRKNDDITVYIHDFGDNIAISVKDTGIGIPEGKLNTIFNRFEQVDKTYTRNREGSGIGLSLAKTLTELHGGSIEVISTLGQGSEFIVNLPVTIVEVESEVALTTDDKIDKINIEFSDIYSNE